MNFNKTTSYAIKILQFLSQNPLEQINSKTLHNHLNIPHQYLRHILTQLSKHDYIDSSRGREGGFILKKLPSEIFIADIINSFEGLDNIQKCIIGDNQCQFDGHCSLHEFWSDQRTQIIDKLKSTSLENFIM